VSTTGTPVDFIPEKQLNNTNNTTILWLRVGSDGPKYTNEYNPGYPASYALTINSNFTNRAGSAPSTVTGPTFAAVVQAVNRVLPTISTRTVIIPPTGESGRVYPRPKKYVRV
jgi:hypothetical protein